MCLIIYSPDAKLPPRHWFSEAAESNPDGIGVMSADGVTKFLGKKKTRRAWRCVEQLSAAGIPYGVHFRWATHGRVNRDNCHPFEVPNTGAWLMHNGVLWTSHFANDDMSDTRVFADEIMPELLTLAYTNSAEYLRRTGREASGNRLLVMHPDGKRFDVINPDLWVQKGGIWYSNTYSIGAMGGWQTRKSYAPQYSQSKGNLASTGLLPVLSRGLDSWPSGFRERAAAVPSGPALDYAADTDDDVVDRLEEDWWTDYEDALDSGMSDDDAQNWADQCCDRRAAALASMARDHARAWESDAEADDDDARYLRWRGRMGNY